MNRIAFILTLALCGRLFAEMRLWTDADGSRFQGEFAKELFGDVLIKDVKHRNHFIPLESLSAEDREYIDYHVPPEVEMSVDFQTRPLPKTDWSREDDDTTLYAFSVEIEKTSRLPYKGELIAELFVLADERARESEEHCVLMAYKPVHFVFPEADKSTYRFSVPDVSFHAYRASWVLVPQAVERGKTCLGTILALSDSSGRLIACQTDITKVDWLVEDMPRTVQELRTLYKANPGSVESRHFDDFFSQVDPPRIPWFRRAKTD